MKEMDLAQHRVKTNELPRGRKGIMILSAFSSVSIERHGFSFHSDDGRRIILYYLETCHCLSHCLPILFVSTSQYSVFSSLSHAWVCDSLVDIPLGA
jgi:hypothetical protein